MLDNKDIIDIVFDNEDGKVSKKYTVKNNNIVIDQSNFDKIKKNKQSKIDLLKIDKNAKKKVLEVQILNIKKAKICKYVMSKNRSKFCVFWQKNTTIISKDSEIELPKQKKKLYFFQTLELVTIFQMQQSKTRDKFNDDKINIDKI